MKNDAGPKAVSTARETGSGLGNPPAPGIEPDLDGAFADDGVDLSLIRWMLRLSPTERLQAAQDLIDAAWALRTDSEA